MCGYMLAVVTHVLQDLQDGLQDQGTMFLPSEYLGLMFPRSVWELFAECLGPQKFAHLFRVVLSCMPVIIMGVSKDAKKKGYGNSGHVRLLARLALMRMQVKA